MENKKLLTVTEASSMLGLSRSLTYQLIKLGSIKSIKIGKARRIPIGEIDAFVVRCSKQGDEAFASSR